MRSHARNKREGAPEETALEGSERQPMVSIDVEEHKRLPDLEAHDLSVDCCAHLQHPLQRHSILIWLHCYMAIFSVVFDLITLNPEP